MAFHRSARWACGYYTWEQIQGLYRLTVPAAIPNFQPVMPVSGYYEW